MHGHVDLYRFPGFAYAIYPVWKRIESPIVREEMGSPKETQEYRC